MKKSFIRVASLWSSLLRKVVLSLPCLVGSVVCHSLIRESHSIYLLELIAIHLKRAGSLPSFYFHPSYANLSQMKHALVTIPGLTQFSILAKPMFSLFKQLWCNTLAPYVIFQLNGVLGFWGFGVLGFWGFGKRT